MKAIVNPQQLLRELKKLSLVVRKINIMPIAGSALFQFKKDNLVITGTDTETIHITSLSCTCEEEFSFCIDYFDIFDICSKLSAPMQILRKDNLINITSGSSKFKISVVGEIDEFPNKINDEYNHELDVDGDFFYHLSNANTCKSKDELRAALSMVAIRVYKDYYDVAACDGFVLYMKKFLLKSPKEFEAMVCDKFVTLCKSFQESTLYFNEKFVKVIYKDETIISRLSESKFANINAIIPTEINYNIVIDKEELKNAVEIVGVSASGQQKEFSLSFKKGEMKLTSTILELNKETETTVNIEHSINIEEICLGATQLLGLINLVQKGNINLSFTDKKKSVFINPSEDEDVVMMIQPLFAL